jgi:two-component system response regulator ChvI
VKREQLPQSLLQVFRAPGGPRNPLDVTVHRRSQTTSDGVQLAVIPVLVSSIVSAILQPCGQRGHALAGGAVDFIDKSRRLSILLRRLKLNIEGTRPVPEQPSSEGRTPGDHVRLGKLDLRFDINRASWDNHVLDLTLTEFKIVALLAMRTGEDVGYREIYDLVHGKNFIAGYGAEGYRANVRTFIKRIRKKFRDVDDNFDHIENYAGFGYRWTA